MRYHNYVKNISNLISQVAAKKDELENDRDMKTGLSDLDLNKIKAFKVNKYISVNHYELDKSLDYKQELQDNYKKTMNVL